MPTEYDRMVRSTIRQSLRLQGVLIPSFSRMEYYVTDTAITILAKSNTRIHKVAISVDHIVRELELKVQDVINFLDRYQVRRIEGPAQSMHMQ